MVDCLTVVVVLLTFSRPQEREEEERERREERVRLDRIKREERRALEKAKRESESRSLGSSEEQMDLSIDISLSESTTMSDSFLLSTPQPSVTSSSRTTQAAADTSSDVEKKHKEKFVKEMSKVVVKILDPYRKKGVKGHIRRNDDFKYLAKKVISSLSAMSLERAGTQLTLSPITLTNLIYLFQLTFNIMHKELKVCKNIEELKANEKVKKKASDYVSKYMKKYDREYKRSPNQAD